MYDNPDTVERSFDENYISESLLQAQWAEFVELKKVITEVSDRKGTPVSILDIGIGSARIATHLCGVKEIWDRVLLYDGTDNAQACVELSQKNIAEKGIADKVTAYLFDGVNLRQWQKRYDMVITTWFTAGNLYPDEFPFETYKGSAQRLDLSFNEKFDKVFSAAFDLLEPGGEIVIGACYLDNDATKLKQEESYRKLGMHIITSAEDSFTATAERFWSQRFTIEKLYRYLHFAPREKIIITPLDTYDYAMQVRVRR